MTFIQPIFLYSLAGSSGNQCEVAEMLHKLAHHVESEVPRGCFNYRIKLSFKFMMKLQVMCNYEVIFYVCD